MMVVAMMMQDDGGGVMPGDAKTMIGNDKVAISNKKMQTPKASHPEIFGKIDNKVDQHWHQNHFDNHATQL